MRKKSTSVPAAIGSTQKNRKKSGFEMEIEGITDGPGSLRDKLGRLRAVVERYEQLTGAVQPGLAIVSQEGETAPRIPVSDGSESKDEAHDAHRKLLEGIFAVASRPPKLLQAVSAATDARSR